MPTSIYFSVAPARRATRTGRRQRAPRQRPRYAFRTMTIHVVPFRPEHQADAANLVFEIQSTEFNVPVTLEGQPDLQDIAAFFQRGRGNFWVALDGDRVVGTLGAKDIGDGRVALRKMFVAKEYRGKTAGTAVLLLDTLLGWARDHGVREIVLGTIDVLHAAHRFYEKNGFARIDERDLPPNFPRMPVDNRFYQRALMS